MTLFLPCRKILVFLVPLFFIISAFSIAYSKGSFSAFNDQVVYFNVIKSGYTLDFKWATSPDVHIFNFTVETSQSAEIWTPLNHLKAGRAKEYSLKGLTPKWSTAYYRLKVTDVNGNHSYTKPVKVSLYYRNLDDLMVYPNPLSSNAQTKLKFSRKLLRGSKISVFSINGVHQFDQVLQKDTEIIELPPLEAGNYFIEIVDASDVLRLKIAVK